MDNEEAQVGIDYRDLLIKYIAHVLDAKGSDFLDERGEVPFAEQEWVTLTGLRNTALPMAAGMTIWTRPNG